MNFKSNFLIIFCLIGLLSHAQNSRWEDHFSYKSVSGITQVGNFLYCTSSHAIFSYDLEYNELKKISKTNKLNSIQPTSLAYNQAYDYVIVGYLSGELDILGEQSYNFIEIPLDEYQGSKKINHLYTEGQWLTISAAYGVSMFNLERREFAETAFFRQSGDFFTANESVIFNNRLYAASERGVYSHEMNDLIPNFNNWELAQNLPSTDFKHIEKFNEQLIAASGGNVYVFQNGNWSVLRNFGAVKDLNATADYLSITTANTIYVLDANLNQVGQSSINATAQAGIFVNNEAFVGTAENGMIRLSSQEAIYPDGPFSNSTMSVTATQQNVWMTHGGIIDLNLPAWNTEGYSHFNGIEWQHVGREEMNNVHDVTQITVNPNDINQIYATSWHQWYGVFEMNNDELVAEYNSTNSSILYNRKYEDRPYMKLGGTDLDKQGNLYVTQSYIGAQDHNLLHKKTPAGSWSSFSLQNFNQGAPGVQKPVVDDKGFVWVASGRGSGLVVTNMDEAYQILSGEGQGNLPSSNVFTVAIDKNSSAWIGTQQGLHVKSNALRELQSGNPETQPIVIVQDGIPEALLTDIAINDIAVDGSNRKWIATRGAGVFYVSEFGRETIFHFTEDNSPLPSNVVYDISVDNTTGMVYFATQGGLVSYKGDAKDTGDSFGEIVAYPNPVRPNYNGVITIKGLADRADVRITDVVGNLIHKDRAAGGIIQWDGTNLKGQKVASGIYLALMINADGTETASTKIAIIR